MTTAACRFIPRSSTTSIVKLSAPRAHRRGSAATDRRVDKVGSVSSVRTSRTRPCSARAGASDALSRATRNAANSWCDSTRPGMIGPCRRERRSMRKRVARYADGSPQGAPARPREVRLEILNRIMDGHRMRRGRMRSAERAALQNAGRAARSGNMSAMSRQALSRMGRQHARLCVTGPGLFGHESAWPGRDERRARQVLRQLSCTARGHRGGHDGWLVTT
jgi:hypothetical protein